MEKSPAQIDAENRDRENREADDVSIGAEDVHEGRAEEQRTRERRSADDDAGSEADEQKRGSKFDDKRKSVWEAAREARKAEQIIRDDAVLSTDDRLAERFPAPVESTEPRKMKLLVNDVEEELPEEEVRALAQKARAAEGILDQAKAMKAQAQAVLERVQQEAANQRLPAESDPATKPAGTPPTIAIAEDELDAVAERIQYGEKADVVAALKEFGTGLIGQLQEHIGNLDERIQQNVDALTETRERQKTSAEVLDTFVKANSEFDDPDLAPALATASLRIMRANMMAAGVAEETLSKYAAERQLTPHQAVGRAYRDLVALEGNKFNLPTHATVLNTAAGEIRKKFGITEKRPAPANLQELDTSRRSARKETVATQPRRATAPLSSERREKSRTENAINAVKQMKAARRGRIA